MTDLKKNRGTVCHSPVIVIPTLNPDRDLIVLVEKLRQQLPEAAIIVVNDGSAADREPLFALLNQMNGLTVLKHHVNLGKGRALKTAFNYFLNTFPDSPGVITADGDGQHLPGDIQRCALELCHHPDALILGTRAFPKDGVPWASWVGNHLTRLLFTWVLRYAVSDTQTGLRGISRRNAAVLLNCAGERFDFETAMLLDCRARRVPISEVQIQTVYIQQNQGTHFRPLVDSLKIYRLLFRALFSTLFAFLCSGLLAAVIDVALFALLFHLVFVGMPGRLVAAVFAARAVSMVTNYLVNRNLVFGDSATKRLWQSRSFVEYLLLCLLITGSSYGLVKAGMWLWPAPDPVWLKIGVDSLLFVFSYQIQKRFIFARN